MYYASRGATTFVPVLEDRDKCRRPRCCNHFTLPVPAYTATQRASRPPGHRLIQRRFRETGGGAVDVRAVVAQQLQQDPLEQG